MTDALIGQSYYLRFDPKLWDAMQPYPPLGSLYAAAYVRQRGYSVALFDAMLASSTDAWCDALDRHTPRIAIILEDGFNYLSKMCLSRMREAALTMIGSAKARGATVIVSGSDATDNLDRYFAAGADYAIIGEAEIALGELLDVLGSGGCEGRVSLPGVASRGMARADVIARPSLRDLDTLPFPAWDLVDLEQYRSTWMRRHGYFSINMATTRGCPYHCNWCAKPIYGQRYVARTAENVVQELAELKARIAPDHLWFADDIFGLKKGWIERFADLVCTRGLQTPFKCLLRTDLVTESVASGLARAGCRTVWMGVESGSQRVLDAMEKGATVEDAERATRLLRASGIEVGFFLQFGYPGEEWSDIQETIGLVRRCAPDDIGISVAYPLPGTPFFERVRAELGPQQNWVDSNDLAMLYRGLYSTAFYRRLHTRIHREFRARRAWRQLRSGRLQAVKPLLAAVRLPFEYCDLIRLRGQGRRDDPAPASPGSPIQ
jgi:anaerobic magnesium-protoporphyrin IX monomethyl ester cyclase